VIGDVCGTGPTAAALTGLARHSIRASAWHGDSPAEVLSSLNHAVLQSGSGSFLTAVYATLRADGPRPVLTVACGGHPPPIRVGPGGVSTIGTPGKLIGMFEDAGSTPRPTSLSPGDVVVFYTDGATDVPPPHSIDNDQFTSLVEHAAAGATTAEQVADRLRSALESVLSFTRREDDIALLVLRITERA
jgi:serine phosphatase RsbU (regulator of sigma subunit)